MVMTNPDVADDSVRNVPWSNDNAFDPSWKRHPSASTLPLPSSLKPIETGHILPIPHQPPAPGAPRVEATSLFALSALPTTSLLTYSPLCPSNLFHSRHTAQVEADFALPVPRSPVAPDGLSILTPGILGDGQQRPGTRGATSHDVLHSPFRDCIGTFGLHKSQHFSRPIDGKVNGYIKFSWPKETRETQYSVARTQLISDNIRVVANGDSFESSDRTDSQSSMNLIGPSLAPSRSGADSSVFTIDISNCFWQSPTFNSLYHTPVGLAPSHIVPNASAAIAPMGTPKKLPSQYGYDAKMDETDRRFWMFYIRNWCPGRSVLEDTNLWLKDFAQMHKSAGVRSAIQSLAGIYIHDYLPFESIRKRVNQRFADAEERFSQLLGDPATAENEAQVNEFITIAAVLSMQDIVLTERRLKNLSSPRWLQGFSQAEQFLQVTDHGSRFWKPSNVQSSSLRISQSVIVGRAIILAQPMSPLPPPDKFNCQKEASRFGWLLYGTEENMYQIHGGCGFSRKLLHVLSQVIYCAARLEQEAESPVIPTTAIYLHTELLEMRQWSTESMSWNDAKSGPSVIELVHCRPEGYKIKTNADMTDVTAEAWRIAAMIYLQCRVFRLPRNHPDIVSKLNDLAKCIAIMPTSGTQFTAQAPLFPVFLLGLLATVPEHKVVSSNWFDEVLQTPVRSSVPPLHNALLHTWTWIDRDIPVSPPYLETYQPISLRRPWWEELVTLVRQQEQEVLCLT